MLQGQLRRTLPNQARFEVSKKPQNSYANLFHMFTATSVSCRAIQSCYASVECSVEFRALKLLVWLQGDCCNSNRCYSGCVFSTNLIDLDLHRFVRGVQSSPVKKNAPYRFGIPDLQNSGPISFSGFANRTEW